MPATTRPSTTGPDSGPQDPFPIRLSGPVIKGFGRGSKELGIPTANIPPDGLDRYPQLSTGVYYGVVVLDPSAATKKSSSSSSSKSEKGDGEQKGSGKPLPAVLSIGFNPFYGNSVRSVEIHVMTPLDVQQEQHQEQDKAQGQNQEQRQSQVKEDQTQNQPTFNKLPDFYSTNLNLLILGYVRPEYNYDSLEALIEDIRVDCEVAKRSLGREAYVPYLGVGLGRGDAVPESVRRDWEWLVTF